jgi:signal peptidase
MLKILKRSISYILLGIAVLVLVYALLARISGENPSFFGLRFFRVSSSSMYPELEVGDVILVKETDAADLRLGDTISYLGRVGTFANKVITHKIVEEPYQKNGVYHFTTRGIYQSYEDDPPIVDSQILGRYVCTIPLIGWIYEFFAHWYGLLTFVIIILLAFGAELIGLIRTIRGEEDSEICDDAETSAQTAESTERPSDMQAEE